ncbi:LD-carboxypeptidase [bacterium]|nr:LD-carboxypeptidase [bacterium]
MKIGVAALSSPFDRELFLSGVQHLISLGFEVYFREDIFDQKLFLAGSDKRRTEELLELYEKPDINIIMFARGGYGSQRTLPLLDINVIKNNPKTTIGFSDLTPLLNFLSTKTASPVFYGPVITQLGKTAHPETIESLMNAISNKNTLQKLNKSTIKVFKEGSARGKLVGGCLSMINSSIGTPYNIDFTDKILLIEDTGEKAYVIDRLLTQLKNSNKLEKVSGIIIGSLTPKDDEKFDLNHILDLSLNDLTCPIIYNFPTGHCEPFYTLQIGREMSLRTDPLEIAFV